ncbi:hypothetical protein ACKKBG_A30100 [Auxenochlorella protothecoides x Auxenochlorella symbiontica]|uniref:Peptidase S26 domain-containing protein n=1 Tax=Auxenochlorella protothecoides TaxID=3075 RepID=A0A1D2A8K4_AUXPR
MSAGAGWAHGRSTRSLRSLLERAIWFAKAAAAIHVFRNYVAEFTVPIGLSMSPTFNTHGDVALLERVSVATRSIKVGDVVVARSVQNVRHIVIKRVLGLEGDVVPLPGSTTGRRVAVVPKGHVWLQGDNFHNSTDSRTYGPVPYALLQGRVFLKIWPPQDAGWVRSGIPDYMFPHGTGL